MAWAFGFRNLIIPGNVLPLTGMPFDMARNEACKATLAGPFQYLFFLDSDVIPPADAVLRLMAHGKPLISGLYCRRSHPATVPVMIRNRQWVVDFQPGSIQSVDLVGSGCLLIHRSVLERLPPLDEKRGKRWFDWRVDMRGVPGVQEDQAMSEDFMFCAAVRAQLGIPVLVDTSVVCRHCGFAEATYRNLQPLGI
jgi:hypothetical protein